MKISIITPSFPFPKSGILPGIERSVENLAFNLKKLGHDIKIITTYWNGGKRHGSYKDIPILRVLDSKALLGKIGSLFLINYITFGLNIIRKRNFKFINNSNVIILPIAIGFTRFFKIKKIHVIPIFHHYSFPSSFTDHLYLPFYNFLIKRQFKLHQNVITRSESSKLDIIKYFGIKNKNIEIITDGINLKDFNPKKESPKIRKIFGNNIILYVGPFYKRKRVPVLLKSMQYVIKKFPDAQLILIGHGPQWNYCRTLSKKLNIIRNTKFLGYVDYINLLKYYASSDIFVFPSELEGFGQVILEAMASGTPVICANKPPMSEIIENGGITFKLNDPKDLSNQIIYLLKHRNKLKELKNNSLNIINKYEWTYITRKYINYIYKNFLDRCL